MNVWWPFLTEINFRLFFTHIFFQVGFCQFLTQIEVCLISMYFTIFKKFYANFWSKSYFKVQQLVSLYNFTFKIYKSKKKNPIHNSYKIVSFLNFVFENLGIQNNTLKPPQILCDSFYTFFSKPMRIFLQMEPSLTFPLTESASPFTNLSLKGKLIQPPFIYILILHQKLPFTHILLTRRLELRLSNTQTTQMRKKKKSNKNHSNQISS